MEDEIDISDREKGIEAIIALQKMVGISEPRAAAAAGWDLMSDWQKRRTLRAYEIFNG